MGTAAGYGQPDGKLPPYNVLENNTFAAFGDLDASPTKALLVIRRLESSMKPFFELGFARRPAEELYDLKRDPDQVHNLAADPSYTEIRTNMSRRLLQTLKSTGDPRVTGDGSTFDKPPFSDPFRRRRPANNKKRS